MNAPFKIKVQPRTMIRANVNAHFPANVIGMPPIHVTQNALNYTISIDVDDFISQVGGGVSNGNKGDITVSGGGLTWTINNLAVSYAKMQNTSGGSVLLGRGAGAGGSPQEITLGAGLSMTGTVLSAAGASLPVTEPLIALSDVASVPLDASLGNQFKLLANGNRTIQVPTNAPAAGRTQKIVIVHEAVGGTRTLALAGGVGGFRFGSDLTALTPTPTGLADYIGAIWNERDSTWDVVSFARGF